MLIRLCWGLSSVDGPPAVDRLKAAIGELCPWIVNHFSRKEDSGDSGTIRFMEHQHETLHALVLLESEYHGTGPLPSDLFVASVGIPQRKADLLSHLDNPGIDRGPHAVSSP